MPTNTFKSMSYVECPQCKNWAIFKNFYAEKETSISCMVCGYHYEKIFVKEEMDKSGKSLFSYIENEEKGYGAMTFNMEGNRMHTEQLKEPCRGHFKRQFFEILKHFKDKSDKCYLTKWNEKKKRVEIVYGTPSNIEGLRIRPKQKRIKTARYH